jgi:hypothetical protein
VAYVYRRPWLRQWRKRALRTSAGGTTTPVTVTVSSTTAVSATRSVGKIVAVTSSSAVTLARAVAKAIVATSTTATAIVKQAGKILAVACSTATTVSAIRVFLATINATSTSAVALTKSAGKGISTALSGAVTVARAIGKGVGVTSSGAVAVGKAVAHAFSATSSSSTTAAGSVVAPVAYRSQASTTYASRTNTVVTPPAGLIDGDIILAAIFVSATAPPPSVTPPAGFTAVSGSPTSVNDGTTFGQLNVFWKRANSESGNYTFTHTLASSQGLLIAISGAATSGSPIDAVSNNTGTGTTTTALSVTTTMASDLLVYMAHDWVGSGTLNPPTSFTERFDSIVYDADVTKSVAGSSGNVTQTNGNSAGNPWGAFLVAIKPPGGSITQQPWSRISIGILIGL